MSNLQKPIEPQPHPREFVKAEPPWPGVVATALCALFGGLSVWASAADYPPWLFAGFCVAAYLAGGWGPTKSAFESLLQGKLNVDLLMIVAAIGAASIGDWLEGAVLLFLFSLSGALEAFAMYRTARSIESLVNLRPREALLLDPTGERRIPVEALRVGDRVRVKPGERFPVDGLIEEGETWADESTLTGESEMISKPLGAQVFAGTINGQGGVVVLMTKAGEDSTLARIVHMVQEAQAQKTPTQRIVESWQRPYVIGVFTLSLLVFFGGKILHTESWHDAFYHAMVILVAASPCAVVVSSPSVMLSAIARAARQGVLFKGAVHLETLGQVETIAFDKTGTVTFGKPSVTDLWARPGVSGKGDTELLLRLASAVEHRSEHPLGAPVIREAKEKGVFPSNLVVTDFQSRTGLGIWARVNDPAQEPVWVGVGREGLFSERGISLPGELVEQADRIRSEGKTALLVVSHRNGEHTPLEFGIIGVADKVRPEAREVLDLLGKMGIKKRVILTGDHQMVARIIGHELHADEVRAGLMPDQKVVELARLQENSTIVAMVGDGVNDAPALAAASVGIAMGGAGTDVALEVADVVLMRDDLRGLPVAVMISRMACARVRQNMLFAFGVIAFLVMGAFFDLPLWMGVIGHEGSTVLVGLNGLRLLWEKLPIEGNA